MNVRKDEDVTRPPSPTPRSVVLNHIVVCQVDTALVTGADTASGTWVRLDGVAIIVATTRLNDAE